MSNYLEAIPAAVATIVASIPKTISLNSDADLDKMQKRIIDLADQLTRTLAKALRDTEEGK